MVAVAAGTTLNRRQRALGFEVDIAGSLHWKALRRRNDLAAFDFPGGTFVLTEQSTNHSKFVSVPSTIVESP